jgi:hypothetical protein
MIEKQNMVPWFSCGMGFCCYNKNMRSIIAWLARTRLGVEIAHAWAEMHGFMFVREEELSALPGDE